MPAMSTEQSERANGPWRLRRSLARLLVFLGVLYVLWLLAACTFERSILFPRQYARTMPSGHGIDPSVERGWLATDEGDVEVWYIPGRGVSAESPGGAVMFFHGNGETIDFLPDSLAPYRALNFGVMLVEYRGYGRSAGTPSQSKLTADAVAAYDLLIARAEVDPRRVILHGRSIGAAVACQVAAEREAAALILQSPFSSFRSMAQRYAVPGFLVSDPFDSASVLEEYDGPSLIMHGSDDTMIPIAQGRALAECSTQCTFVAFDDAGHNDFPFDSSEHWDVVTEFLRAHGLLNATGEN